jgi:hypothetical protein
MITAEKVYREIFGNAVERKRKVILCYSEAGI